VLTNALFQREFAQVRLVLNSLISVSFQLICSNQRQTHLSKDVQNFRPVTTCLFENYAWKNQQQRAALGGATDCSRKPCGKDLCRQHSSFFG